MNGLKPCPFCGCEVEITTYRDEGYQIECPNHEWPKREMRGEKRPESDIAADIGMYTWGISDEAKTALIEAWNTRTPEQAIAATLGGGKCELVYGENDHGDDGWWCQSCGGWFAASFRHTGRNNIIEPRFCQHCGKAVER